jgi:hypothetical protein
VLVTCSYSIRTRLILLVALTVLPALGLMAYSAWEQRIEAAADAQETALRLVRNAADKKEEIIETSRQLLVTLAKLAEVQNRQEERCSILLREILKEHPIYANIGVVDARGDIFCSAMPLNRTVNVADRLYFRKAVATKTFAMGEYQIGRVTGQPVLVAAYPVFDSNGATSGPGARVGPAQLLDFTN